MITALKVEFLIWWFDAKKNLEGEKNAQLAAQNG